MEELKSAAPKTDSQISTTDEYIPLQDTDGNLVKINPASFQEAVRNVLGGLLANNDKGVTISGIPALSGSGASLDFGSVTPANLASVLGVNKYIKEFSVPGPDGYNSGIKADGGYQGQTLLVMYSEHSNSGDATDSGLFMIRCGYDGNNFSRKEIATEQGSGTVYPLNVTVDTNGNFIFSDTYGTHNVIVISNKPI